MIKVYSTKSCKYCVIAKDYLEQNGYEFEVMDIGSDAEAKKEMLALTGVMAVPVIKIGDKHMLGWDIDKFKQLNEENSTQTKE